jgi:hypothetical protein
MIMTVIAPLVHEILHAPRIQKDRHILVSPLIPLSRYGYCCSEHRRATTTVATLLLLQPLWQTTHCHYDVAAVALSSRSSSSSSLSHTNKLCELRSAVLVALMSLRCTQCTRLFRGALQLTKRDMSTATLLLLVLLCCGTAILLNPHTVMPLLLLQLQLLDIHTSSWH